MSATEQRFRLVFDTSANLAALKATIQEAKQGTTAVQGLTTATRQHAAAVTADESGLRKWASSLRQTIPELQRAQRAQHAAAVQAAEQQRQEQMLTWGQKWRGSAKTPGSANAPAEAAKTTGGGRGGLALLEASRAIEDAQYGISGVLNNLPGLIAMLGGGAGLAGALSIAAVGATQLWKVLANGKDAAEKSGLKELHQMVTDLKAEYEALGTIIKDEFTADLAEAREKAEKELTAWRRAIEAGDKNRKNADAKADQAKTSAEGKDLLDAQQGILEGHSPQAVAAQVEEAKRLRDAEAQRAALRREQEAQVANLERAKNGVVGNKQAADQARGRLNAVRGMRRDQIIGLGQQGIESDQAQIVIDYEAAMAERDRQNAIALKAEQELASLPDPNDLTDPINLNPAEQLARRAMRAAATERRDRAGKGTRESAARADSLRPLYDQARADFEAGRVTYNKANERTDLTPDQRAALVRGQAGLEGINQFEASAKEDLKKAEAEVAAGQESLKQFVTAIDDVTARMQDFETRFAAENMQRGRDKLDIPLPTLPGEPVQIVPPGNALPELPPGIDAAPPPMDIRPQTDSVVDAIRESQRLVMQAMQSMANATEQTATATAGAVQGIRSQMAGLEGKFSQIRERTLE